MILSLPYRFLFEFHTEERSSRCVVAAQHDFEPLHEWTRFDCQRRGEVSLTGRGSASVVPVWDDDRGEPYCNGIRVEIAEPDGAAASRLFSNRQFQGEAQTIISQFVAQGRLRAGEKYFYDVLAYPAAPEPVAKNRMTITEASPPVPARDAALAPLIESSRACGNAVSGTMPVFVPAHVVDEIGIQTRAHEGIETGGILLGTLGRDPDSGEIFAVLTAQIPGEHTTGSAVKLSFSAQSWAAADAALRLRGRGEFLVGFFHSHPVKSWCAARSCTLEAQKSCPLAKDFFSEDDAAVMRAAFPRAWCVAIVANDTAFDLTFSMFGNHEGAMEPRGFYILEDAAYVTPCR